MRASQLAAVVFCVCLISLGQVLFKYVGLMSTRAHGGLDTRTVLSAMVALGIYGVATLVWIYLLRSIELSKAYPFMALSFVVVPLAAAVFYGETIAPAYYLGLLLIVSGIVVIARLG